MAKKKVVKKQKANCCENIMSCKDSGCGGCAYFLGFIGAAVYNISIATSFWVGVWGVIKALVWPAFLVFKLLKYLG
jgi:hypothetical protein